MAYGRRDGFSYSDGVPLKINDRLQPGVQVFFPPQAIAAPNLFENEYDFSVERSALRQYELHKRRKEAIEKAKVDKVAQEIETFTHVPQEAGHNNAPQPSTNNNETVRKTTLRNWPNGTLLNPQPLVKDHSPNDTPEILTKQLNLADFESQSSSPFDIMELQSLNDLEELNTVFQGIAVSSPAKTEQTNAANHETYAKVVHQPVNGYQVYPDARQYHTFSATEKPASLYNGYDSPSAATCMSNAVKDNVTFARLKVSKSTPDIRDELAQECNSNRSQTPPPYGQPAGQFAVVRDADVHHPWRGVRSSSVCVPGVSSPQRETETECLPNPYHELEESQQLFSATIAQMGFNLDRVARTVKHLGTDEKKVVDHLCHVQNLEESGYEGNDAETALHLYDYNFQEAKIFLDLLKQFQDLGFPKSAARKALIRHKNDRDRALDSLLLT